MESQNSSPQKKKRTTKPKNESPLVRTTGIEWDKVNKQYNSVTLTTKGDKVVDKVVKACTNWHGAMEQFRIAASKTIFDRGLVRNEKD